MPPLWSNNVLALACVLAIGVGSELAPDAARAGQRETTPKPDELLKRFPIGTTPVTPIPIAPSTPTTPEPPPVVTEPPAAVIQRSSEGDAGLGVALGVGAGAFGLLAAFATWGVRRQSGSKGRGSDRATEPVAIAPVPVEQPGRSSRQLPLALAQQPPEGGTGCAFDVDPRWLPLLGGGATIVVGTGAAMGPLAGACAVVAAAVVLLAVYRPDVAAVCLVATTPVLSGLRRGLPVPGFRLSELLIVGLGTIVLISARRRGGTRWQLFDTAAVMYIVATMAFGVFDLLKRGDQFTGDATGALLGPLQFFILYRAVVVAAATAQARQRALRLLLLASIPASIAAILQQAGVAPVRRAIEYATGTDIYASLYQRSLYGFETVVPRATGFFPHWHALGGYLFLVLLLCLGLLLGGSGQVMRRRWLVVTAVPAAIALAETVSIAPIMATIGGAIVLGLWHRRGGRVLAGLTCAAVLVAAVFGSVFEGRAQQQFYRGTSGGSSLVPQTISYRYELWRTEFIPLVEQNLLTGYGPTLPPEVDFPHTESLYITMLLRGGVVLLASYLFLMGALLARARGGLAGDDPEERVVAQVMIVAIVMLAAIHGITTYFIDSGVPHVLWPLAGLLGLTVSGIGGTVREAATRVR